MIEANIKKNKILSPKETEVFKRLAIGLTYSEIAQETSRSEETVRTHAKAIREKLHAHSIVQAVAVAAANGLLVFKNKGGLFSIAMVLFCQFSFDEKQMIRTTKLARPSIVRKIDAA